MNILVACFYTFKINIILYVNNFLYLLVPWYVSPEYLNHHCSKMSCWVNVISHGRVLDLESAAWIDDYLVVILMSGAAYSSRGFVPYALCEFTFQIFGLRIHCVYFISDHLQAIIWTSTYSKTSRESFSKDESWSR
jgi:hypothetical protein